MATTALKYNINHQVSLLPRQISIEQFVQSLIKECANRGIKISERTFYRDRNIVKSDSSVIPTDRLEVYAGLFGVSVDALKNYEVKKIKPLAERKLSTLSKKLGIKTGK